jgi:hypothetical protein
LGTGVVSCLSLRLEWLVEDKRSSLFGVVIGDDESKDLCPCHQGSLLLKVVAHCYDGWQVNLKKELFCTPASFHSGKWRVLAKVYYKMDFLFHHSLKSKISNQYWGLYYKTFDGHNLRIFIIS